MHRNRLLFLVSTLVLLLAIGTVMWFSAESSTAIGTVFGAAAGVLAVIWFSASLYYQSEQLKEQREQFLENFAQLREDNRRSSLTLVKDVLARAEERALRSNPELKSIEEITAHYMNAPDWKTIVTTTDPDVILAAGRKWMLTQEGPAVFMMRGIKNAAEAYFRAVGDESIDYSLEAEEFVVEYGPTLWKLPFFEEYAGVGLLPQFMVNLTPVRASLKLAYLVAAFRKASGEGLGEIYRKDKILEDIREHVRAHYPLPAIAEYLAEEAAEA